MAEIECVAFARQYAENAHLIHTDSGLYISGTISLREDEPPKILVNRIEALVENTRFRPEEHAPKTGYTPKAEPVEKAELTREKTHNVPQSETQKTVVSQKIATPRRLFLRVPDAKGDAYLKALNLAELFEGDFPVFFYYANEKRYETAPLGVAVSDYVLQELRALLGEENVILK